MEGDPEHQSREDSVLHRKGPINDFLVVGVLWPAQTWHQDKFYKLEVSLAHSDNIVVLGLLDIVLEIAYN